MVFLIWWGVVLCLILAVAGGTSTSISAVVFALSCTVGVPSKLSLRQMLCLIFLSHNPLWLSWSPADVVAGYGGGEAFCSLRISLHFLMGRCHTGCELDKRPSASLPSFLPCEAGRIVGAWFTHLSSPQVTGCNSKASHEGRSLIKEEKAPCVFQNASSLAWSLPLPWTPGEGSLPAKFTVRTCWNSWRYSSRKTWPPVVFTS